MTRNRNYQVINVNLAKSDLGRLSQVGLEEDRSMQDIAREAIRLYLDNREQLNGRGRESEIAQSIKAMTDRVCGMLARQGAAIGTLYELTWMGLTAEEAKQAFNAAGSIAKQKMRTSLTEDERVLAEKMGKIAKQAFEMAGSANKDDSSKA